MLLLPQRIVGVAVRASKGPIYHPSLVRFRTAGRRASSTSRTEESPEETKENDRKGRKTEWRAPFWLPPPTSPKNPRKRHTPQQRRHPKRFRNESLPCREHFDPHGRKGLCPTSDWVQLFGALPMTNLEEVLQAVEGILYQELYDSSSRYGGVVDLDAHWNPFQEDLPPLVPPVVDCILETSSRRFEYALDPPTPTPPIEPGVRASMESYKILKAHVVLSPFGRPTGWNLQLTSPSMANALLRAKSSHIQGSIRIGWRLASVREHHPTTIKIDHEDTRTLLVVNDSMVRFENCPYDMTEDHLRHMLSRYELTTKGPTIVQWKGKTADGKVPPLTYVVRFASPAYARAAVREMQGKLVKGQSLKLIPYPKQLL